MSVERENYQKFRKFALDQGFSLFGVADISQVRDEFNLDKDLMNRFDRAISLGKRLLDCVLDDIKDRPTPLYFHHYRQLNFFLDRGAFLTASYIQDLGFKALAIPASQIIDWDKQKSHVSHKRIAHLAGMGWIGRNNLLVNPKLGSRIRLVTVLTDMPLDLDKPMKDFCGDCRACLEICPANAIKERKEDFDHQACFEKLREFRKSRIVSQYICGLCVKACKGLKSNTMV